METEHMKRDAHRRVQMALLRQSIPYASSFAEGLPSVAVIDTLCAVRGSSCTGILNSVTMINREWSLAF